MKKVHTGRFGMVSDTPTLEALDYLSDQERIPKAAVIRRLIWREAQRWGFQFPLVVDEPETRAFEESAHVG